MTPPGFVRRGDQPEIDAQVLAPAEPGEGAVLHEAQQLRLDGRRDVGDFIEEKRAALRAFEMPGARCARAGEGVLFISEKLALQQRLRQRAAMQRDERRIPPRALRVDGARGQRLARAGRAGDEHRRIRGAGVGDFHEGPLHRGSRADEDRERLARRRGCGWRGAEELAERLLHFVQIERLHEVGGRAELFGGDGGWNPGKNVKLFLACENIANEDYRTLGSGTNEPGTNVVLGGRVQF